MAQLAHFLTKGKYDNVVCVALFNLGKFEMPTLWDAMECVQHSAKQMLCAIMLTDEDQAWWNTCGT